MKDFKDRSTTAGDYPAYREKADMISRLAAILPSFITPHGKNSLGVVGSFIDSCLALWSNLEPGVYAVPVTCLKIA
jgi:hypothetical protein